MEEEHYLFVPMWVIGIGFFVLSLIGCTHMAVDIIDCEEEPFVHTCPDKGHGDCPICCDPYNYEINNEKTLVLGQ